MDQLTFPKNFVWGTATAAYQIEGAARSPGKGESVWDRFSSNPKNIADGLPGDETCDHFHRYPEDTALMADLGWNHYRLSLAWTRVRNEALTGANAQGLDYYDKLIDGLLAKGITPWVTLFHWDLPQKLQDKGGWAHRDTLKAYADYVDTAVTKLGDRVTNWMTFNEPWVYAFCGHQFAAHAPGLRDLKTALAVSHHEMVAHGQAVKQIRSLLPKAKVGIVHNLEWVEPASDREEDIAAAVRHDGAFNRWYLDPLFGRGYPKDLVDWYGPSLMPDIQPGDFELMANRGDFLGINYYTRRLMEHDPAGRGTEGRTFLAARQMYRPFVPRAHFEEWEVWPEGLYKLLTRIKKEYGDIPLYVTENGTSLPDAPSADGAVHDPARLRYLARHMAAAHEAIRTGVDVRGYFVWSFMDNYEWGFGFTKRFGLIHVDYATQKRTVKDSGRWYSGVARNNGFPINDANDYFQA